MRRLLVLFAVLPVGGCLLLADQPADASDGPPETGWLDVSAVGYKSELCALHEDGSLWCGSPASLHQRAGTWLSLSNSCAVRSDGTLLCGIELDEPSFELAGDFVQVSGDTNAGCGLEKDESVRCWPDANLVTGPFVEIGGGNRFACGLRESGTLGCWGISSVIFDEPLTDVPDGTFEYVATYDNVGCALDATGHPQCWGRDLSGLTDIPPGTYTQLSFASSFACGARQTGDAVCWGDDAGDPNHPEATPPVSTPLLRLDIDSTHTCGVTQETRLVCWGS